MKKILMMFCASAILASCAGVLDDDKTPVQSGEIEKSYIAINLMSADPDTRADGATYQDGLAEERVVKSAYFFFFQNGQPFPVTVTGDAVTAPAGTGANFLSATLTGNAQNKPNVSDVKDVVLLLRNYKGQYPNQIVAVLNWVPVAGKSYTMAELAQVVDIQSTMDSQKYFVMSNAVYADGGGQAVTATPLTLANIYTTEAAAKADPVDIYVERIAAKVTVTTTEDTKFNLNKSVNVGGTSVAAYAQLTGWELYNEFNQSYLMKYIDPKWTVDAVGFNWNDQAFFRSYWATSPAPAWTADNAFTWNGGLDFGLSTNVTAGTYADNTYVYCGENTTATAADRTKVILKAKLVKEDGSAIELARWHGADYLSESDLLTVVASTLKNTYYYGVTEGGTTTYTSIDPTDLQCVVGGGADAPAGVDATEVYFQLSTPGAGRDWFEYSSANGYTAVTDEALNTALKAVPSALLYKGGQTYYFFDIKHLGAAGKLAEYGVVRNHIYSININSIGGFGSPVYDPDTDIVTPQYPDEPTDQGSYVSAKVNVLSWRLVSQGVNIQPQS